MLFLNAEEAYAQKLFVVTITRKSKTFDHFFYKVQTQNVQTRG